jgi:hypothetical protein
MQSTPTRSPCQLTHAASLHCHSPTHAGTVTSAPAPGNISPHHCDTPLPHSHHQHIANTSTPTPTPTRSAPYPPHPSTSQPYSLQRAGAARQAPSPTPQSLQNKFAYYHFELKIRNQLHLNQASEEDRQLLQLLHACYLKE